MKRVFLLLSLLITSHAFAYTFTTGGKIHFQKHSTWISPSSKKLCFDGVNFRASIKKCVEYRYGDSSNSCASYRTITALQPARSTKRVCVSRGDVPCVYETRSYYQSPLRTVEVYRSGGPDGSPILVRTKKVVVRDCK